MKPYPDIEGEIRKYLLGTLSEESRQGVEERLMTEEAFLEELTLAEGELIEDYVDGRLDDEERACFEQHFLSTDERHAQLRFARALGRYATAAVEARETNAVSHAARTTTAPTLGERLRAFLGGRSTAWRAGLAFAAVAGIVVAVWLAVPRSPRTFASLTLVAGAGERSGGVEVPKARLPLGADALRITLTLPAGTPPADSYRAEMLTLSDGRAEAVEVAGHDARTVTVVVPEDRLARGRHALRLYASGVGGEWRVGDSYVFDAE